MTEPGKAVFLSYASQDAEVAKRICEALRAAGIEVWFDQSELRGGDAWDQQIRRQIKDCALFIPVISDNTQARTEGYFRLEWRLADQRTHLMGRNRAFLVPVCIDQTDTNADTPESFNVVQWTRLPGGAVSPAFVERVWALLSQRPSNSRSELRAPGAAAEPMIAAEPTSTALSSFRIRRWAVVIAALGVIGVGYFALDKFVPSKRPLEGAETASQDGALAPASSAISDKSVAVLPFADMSEKHDQEYFSDGLAEELLDLLAQVPDLKVPARTSSFYFKTHPASVPELAKILGVRHVLEGSVRKSGNTVRVTVQLIRADTGYHLWSRTFDRDLTDVFKVQDEIASAVVQALQGKLLTSAALIGARQTSSPQAHDLYLLGRQRYSAGSVESDQESMSLFRQATTADPNYAAAYAALSLAEGNLMSDLGRIETLEEYQRRLSDAERAVSLGPKISDGFAVRGDNHLADGDWELARLDVEKAIELDPHDSRAQRFLARYYASQGQLARAIEAASQAMISDPFDSYARVWRGQFEMADGQKDAARADLERVMQLNPANRKAESFLAYLDAVQGQPDAALAHARALPSDSMRVPLESAARCVRKEGKDAVETLNRWMAGAENRSQMYAAAAYALCGQTDKALTALEHDVLRSTHLLSETLEVLKYHAFFAPLRGEPRYQALLRKANLPE